MCFFQLFFFSVGNKTKIIYSRGGGSLSRQPAGFEKAGYFQSHKLRLL